MEFFPKETKIDFMGIRRWTAGLSLLLFVISIASFCIQGINWGLDFTGGTVLELQYKSDVPVADLRELLAANHFEDAVIQSYGNSHQALIRVAPRKGMSEQLVGQKVVAIVEKKYGEVKLLRADAVGSQVGRELATKGSLALLMAMFLTCLYIAFRFEYRFAIGASLALLHDPILILGFFSLFQIEFDLPTLAAMLAAIGYSLNDTVVIFDRVKENFIRLRKGTPIEIMNLSINQTLSRTIMTSVLTLIVLVVLLFSGGPTIFGFALALTIGVIVGTYSSIYVAGVVSIKLGLSKKDLMPPIKDEMLDDRP
jgi:preprotein translocase subunit SecF